MNLNEKEVLKIENKNIKIVIGIIFLMLGTSTGVMTGLFINISKRHNDITTEYDDLYIDYLELLYDFNKLNEKYFNLTGEYIELENDHGELIDNYNALLEAYDILLEALAGLTLTQIETLCNADTYVNNNEPDTNYGNEQYWKAGEEEVGEYEWAYHTAFFNFSLLNKPEIYEKVEIQLHLDILYSEGIFVPFKYFQEWDENTTTYNNMIPIDFIILPFSVNYDLASYSFSMSIDVTEWINTGVDSISIVISIGIGIDNYYVGYSREHPNQDIVPKLLWTIIEASV